MRIETRAVRGSKGCDPTTGSLRSLGGVESLITENLVRVSVGLEETEDLINDFAEALRP